MSRPEPFPIPEEAIEERFITAGGPGGQNVNKVATAVQLRVDVFKLGLSPTAYRRLRELAGSRMTTEGEIVITARTHRTLAELIARAHIRQAKRIRTRPGPAAKAKRLEAKTRRGAVKQARSKPRPE
jgi:ribosome-associated protein